MRVFHAVTSLLPSFGGPAYCVSQLARALAAAGVEVGLWTADRSVLSTPLLSGVADVRRLIGTELQALDKFGEPDIVHDHGIWLAHNHRLAKLSAARSVPRLVSVHGMLEPWTLNHKRWKKRVAWWLYQRRDLARAHCHHATAEMEAANVKRLKLGVPVCVVPNGVDIPPNLARNARRIQQGDVEKPKKRTALFLGRLHPKKGLPMLVEAWACVRPAGWEVRIAGPDEAGHRAEVEKAVHAAHLNNEISFIGPLEGEAKTLALFGADLLVLPTHSENFGIVIAEALAHGLPVLTTTAAPWPMLREYACGWWVNPTVDGIADGLRQATSLEAATLGAMGRRGRKLVATQFGWERVAKEFSTIYENLCRGNRPAVGII